MYAPLSGGIHPFFVVVTLDFEIAVGQQTKANDQIFKGFRTPGAQWCPRESHALIWCGNGALAGH